MPLNPYIIFFLYVHSGYNILQLKPGPPSVKLYNSESNAVFHYNNLITGSYIKCTCIAEKMSQWKYTTTKVQNHERQG